MAKVGRKKKISLEEAEEFLMETDPIVLATDPKMKGKIPLGTNIIFTLPKFSRTLKALQKMQFDEKKVAKYGDILLEDGTILEINKSYNMPLTFELKEMLKKGMLMGGGRAR